MVRVHPLPQHSAEVAQLVEHQPSKLRGRGFESRLPLHTSRCSSEVERFLGKEEVTGSIPVIGSTTTFNVPYLVQFSLYY